jgi:diguanylate cyclase (GGDEF)-like protein
MKKNIVVLVNEIANDYSFSVLDGINSFFSDKDVNLIIITLRTRNDLVSKQSLLGIKLSENQKIDGIIVLSAIFLSRITIEQLAQILKDVQTDNILSLSTPLPIKNSASTYVSCDEAYDKIIRHLKEEHGCKTFAFMSAIETGSEEAIERFEAFKKAIKNNNLEFDENLRFEGFFVYDGALNALLKRYQKKEDINFDAIICANDMMAFACIRAIEQLGLKVPEDVKVFGYDDIIQAQTAELTLSTINQQMEKQGYIAGELVWKKANGEKIPEKTSIGIKPIFRQSCGCSSTESDFLDKMQKHTGNRNMSVSLHLEKNMIQQNIYYLLETLQSEMTLEMLFEMLDSILPVRYIPGIAVCMYDKPLLISDDETFKLPEQATIKVYIDKDKNIKETNLNTTFNPHDMILPDEFFGEGSCTYLIHPIFFGHKQYGYIVCKNITTEYLFAMIYLKTFSSIISQSYIYTKQLEENAKLTSENILLQIDNSELNQISMIDSLTGVFNRRGLITMGNEALMLALKMGTKGMIFFADMDFLKKINDQYGHDMGDLAIKLEAKIFKTVFRSSDIIARLGGDEFAGIIPGLPISHIEKTRTQIKEVCKKVSQEHDLPFEISISFGAVEFNSENCNLDTLIKLADKDQYEEKRKHHLERE